MTPGRLAKIAGFLSLSICLITWIMDLNEMVVQCIYCRNERTAIGLLGILLLLPVYPRIVRYLGLVVGFYGASVSSQHMMLIMNHSHFDSPQLPFTTAALFINIGLVYLIFNLQKKSSGSLTS